MYFYIICKLYHNLFVVQRIDKIVCFQDVSIPGNRSKSIIHHLHIYRRALENQPTVSLFLIFPERQRIPEVYAIFKFVRNHTYMQWLDAINGFSWGMIQHIIRQGILVGTGCWPHNTLRCGFCIRCWVPNERETSEIINTIMMIITAIKQSEVQ